MPKSPAWKRALKVWSDCWEKDPPDSIPTEVLALMRREIPALFRKLGPAKLDTIWFISHALAPTFEREFQWSDLDKGVESIRSDFKWAYRQKKIPQPRYLTSLSDKEIFVLAVWMWNQINGGDPPSAIRTSKNLRLWLAGERYSDPGYTADYTEKEHLRVWEAYGDHPSGEIYEA
jgi:hypothetical protein